MQRRAATRNKFVLELDYSMTLNNEETLDWNWIENFEKMNCRENKRLREVIATRGLPTL